MRVNRKRLQRRGREGSFRIVAMEGTYLSRHRPDSGSAATTPNSAMMRCSLAKNSANVPSNSTHGCSALISSRPIHVRWITVKRPDSPTCRNSVSSSPIRSANVSTGIPNNRWPGGNSRFSSASRQEASSGSKYSQPSGRAICPALPSVMFASQNRRTT